MGPLADGLVADDTVACPLHDRRFRQLGGVHAVAAEVKLRAGERDRDLALAGLSAHLHQRSLYSEGNAFGGRTSISRGLASRAARD